MSLIDGPCYKFLDLKYVDSVIGGNLLFRNVEYFRKLEFVTGDTWIGDRNEATIRTLIKNVTLRSSDILTEEMEIVRTIVGLPTDGDYDITFQDINIMRASNCYVFCISEGGLVTLIENMCSSERTAHVYNACIEIMDARSMENAVRELGVVGGVRVEEDFRVSCDRVRYEDADASISRASLLGGDPFRKGREYEDQKEVRIVLTPRRRIDLGDELLVSLGDTIDLLRMIPIGVTLQRIPPEIAMTQDEAWTSLINIFEFLRAGNQPTPHLPDWDQLEEYDKSRKAEYLKRKARWATKERDIAKSYWVLRNDFPDPRMENCLRGIQSFDGGLDHYLYAFRGKSGMERFRKR